MLTKIREKTQGIIASFILLLIVIPFALWGINSYFEHGTRLPVAEVDGVDISQEQFRQALDQLRGRIDPSVLQKPEFKRLVVDGLIDRTLLVRDAERQGYRLSDAELAQLIRAQPYFQRDGQFDEQLYQGLLRREGIQVREFEERFRTENLTGQVQSGLASTAIVTGSEVDGLVRLLAEEREIAYAVVSPDPLIAKVRLEPQAVEDYYNTHPELFQVPEEVRVDYIRLSAGDLAREYQPSDEELHKAYADEAGRYSTPAKWRASHILIEVPPGDESAAKRALAKAEDIERQLRAGADFAALAKKYSDDKDSAAKGGDLGEIRSGVLPKELEAAVYGLKRGQVSQPVRTGYGYHIVKLTAYTPEKRKSFAAVRNELVQLVRKRRGEERYYELADKFRDLVYEQPDSLAPAAKALGLEIQHSDWFSRSGGSGVAADPHVVEAAFVPEVLGKVRNSDTIELNNETLLALRVIDHRSAARKPLAEVRAQIERQLREDKARELARNEVDELSKSLDGGESLAALAKSRRLKYQGPKMVRRDEHKAMDPRVAEAAFRMPRPQGGKPAHAAVDLGLEGYALVTLDRVKDGDPATADGSLKDKARRLLLEQRGMGYYADYRAGLRQQAKIRVYDDRL